MIERIEQLGDLIAERIRASAQQDSLRDWHHTYKILPANRARDALQYGRQYIAGIDRAIARIRKSI